MQEIVESFKKTMPLIMDLRNPAMRPRHWASLMEAVGVTFDPAGPNFTLDSVVNLHLDQHADMIADLSGNASKELAIEVSIQVSAALQPLQTLHVLLALMCLAAVSHTDRPVRQVCPLSSRNCNVRRTESVTDRLY